MIIGIIVAVTAICVSLLASMRASSLERRLEERELDMMSHAEAKAFREK